MRRPTAEQLDKVKQMLNQSVKLLIDNDSDIFNIDIVEPRRISLDAKILNRELFETTINHRLAYYIERYMEDKGMLNGYHVDIEYNRYYADGKQVETVEGTLVVRPDIIIHSRMNHDHPLQHYLVIEAKKADISPHDLNKIKGFISDERYNYLFGFAVSYCLDEQNVVGSLLYYDGNNIVSEQILISKHQEQ